MKQKAPMDKIEGYFFERLDFTKEQIAKENTRVVSGLPMSQVKILIKAKENAERQ